MFPVSDHNVDFTHANNYADSAKIADFLNLCRSIFFDQ